MAAFSAVLGLAGAALADIGPKPTMSFAFAFDRAGVTISKGMLYQCDNADCSDAEPLRQLGPQGFRCEAQSCSAMAYGFAHFSRLQITLSDGRTLTSNIFTGHAFNAAFRVVVSAAGLNVQPET